MSPNFTKNLLITLFVLLMVFAKSNAQQLVDYYSTYDCNQATAQYTVLHDVDGDGVYETYGIFGCTQTMENQFVVQAIGNIRNWPPGGDPTHTITADFGANGISFLETFFNPDGSILAWFQKSADNDTVYFHEMDNKSKDAASVPKTISIKPKLIIRSSTIKTA